MYDKTMGRKTMNVLGAVCLAAAAFAFSAKAAQPESFDLNRTGALESLQAFERGLLLPQPAAEPHPAAEIAVGPEEFGFYRAEYFESRPEEAAPEQEARPPERLGGDGIIRLYHRWHREALDIRYRDEQGGYIPEAFTKIKRFFRCRLTGREKDVPPALMEILDALQEKSGGEPLIVLSGYRSPRLNNMLARNPAGATRNGLHTRGMSADIMIRGVSNLSALRDAATALKAGGVGYYPAQGFVHVDAGPVRYW